MPLAQHALTSFGPDARNMGAATAGSVKPPRGTSDGGIPPLTALLLISLRVVDIPELGSLNMSIHCLQIPQNVVVALQVDTTIV